MGSPGRGGRPTISGVTFPGIAVAVAVLVAITAAIVTVVAWVVVVMYEDDDA